MTTFGNWTKICNNCVQVEASCRCVDDRIITKVTGNICPSCYGIDFVVEGTTIICTTHSCTWTYDFEGEEQ